MNLDNLPFNWFDVLVLVMVFVGVARGRKRGLSLELFTMSLWLILVLACAVTYMPLGDLLSSFTPFSKLSCYIISYLFVAGFVVLLFVPAKRSLGGKLVSADSFGGGEYYIGMPAGVIRFLCILVAFLALINARKYSTKEIIDNEKYQKEVYGSEFFPGLSTLQDDIFKKSFLGPHIKDYASFLLIKPTPPETKQIVRAKERW